MTLQWGFSELSQQFPTSQVAQSIKDRLYATAAPLKPHYWRMMAAWNQIAVTKDPAGVRDWSTIDGDINDILLQIPGIEIILMIGQGRPGWVNFSDSGSYGDFCTEVATRYKPGGPGIRTDGVYAANAGKGVTHFECWNEENQATFWGGAPDPKTYVAYLKEFYTSIKAVPGLSGTNSKLLTGGFYHVERNQWASLWEWAGIPEVTFLSRCYTEEPNLHNWFDAVAEHIYPQTDTQSYNGSTPGPEPVSTVDNLLQLVAIHDLLVTKGVASPEIWVTETNFWDLGISQAQARDYLEELLTYLDGLSYVPVVIIYNIRDTNAASSTKVEDHCGVVTNDFTPKLVYDFLKTWSPTTGGGGATMTTSGVSVGMTTAADMQVRIQAQLQMGQRLAASTTVGMIQSGSMVNGNMSAGSSIGITTSASGVVNGMKGASTVGMTTTGDVEVLTLVGSTLVGIHT